MANVKSTLLLKYFQGINFNMAVTFIILMRRNTIV